MIFMPGIVWLLAADYGDIPGKFELSVLLSRVTFPYLFFISLVAMLSGLLNARSRFGPGALAPVLLNIFHGDAVTGLHQQFDHADFGEIANVGHFDVDDCHVCQPLGYSRMRR